ncbi:MAG: EamA family transporter RarD, partial [Parvibaculaceae bacterium]
MTTQPVTPEKSAERRAGIAYAVGAYGQWGFYGLFFKLVSVMNPIEVVAHRAFWSMPVAAAALIAMRKLHEVLRAVADPRVLLKLVVTAMLVASNWGFFVWALAMDRTLETSLGYYINPLLNVVIGYVLLGERFTKAQTVAIGLAVLAVCIITVETGVLPWLALLLASTFCAYGYMRKTIPVSAVQGYLVESVILSLLGLPIALWFAMTGKAAFLSNTHDTVLLLLCGPVTALPLMMFSAAARRLRFSTVG